ncbi:enoyl-CoA hydratase/isomerase family protein [Aquisalimonas lutea]|uniref:enoyl-CoA hydratase/isomerase family protein n=1 Tax=Aquisalimonas lutea TaxID=1327750 RepID=UPI0025B53F8F|nr:enoyl-CoA hydratase/isomerase family protein [Aquisalimonas lutea]MDN3519778.1 enoyl-CoA hydratase/isomerase family protein [Aquisalimonas lutea]
MDSTSNIQVTEHGATAYLTLDRPATRNALTHQLMCELDEICRDLRQRTDLTTVVLSGNGPAFCAGADLNENLFFSPDIPADERADVGNFGGEVIQFWERLPQITIVAVEGFVVGGGLTLALSSDFRVFARNAFIYVPEIDLGSNYGWNTVPRLVAYAGPARTKRIVLLAEKIYAEQAETWGLVDFVVSEGKALARATELADSFAHKPRLAVRTSKRAINAVSNALVDVASHGDMVQSLACVASFNERPGE